MKILYVHRTQARGVEGVHIGEIVRGLRRLGHSVEMLSPVGEYLEVLGEEGSSGHGTSSWRTRVLRTLSRLMPETVFELLELVYGIFALREARRRFGDGVVVDAIFERYAIFGFVGAWLAKKWHKPFVLEVNYTSLCPLVRKRSVLLKPLARWLDGWVFRQASAFAVVSSYLKVQLIRDYGIDENIITVLPNAADPEVFVPPLTAGSEHDDLQRRQEIGFVGGFYPWHGLDALVEAFRIVSPLLPRARLVLIGDGPMRQAIEEKVAAYGLGAQVDIRGRVPHKDLPHHVARFDIGVMPDSNVYGSPMKIFEYMAMGVPVLVPDYPPLRDVVEDGVEGRFFAAGDVKQMAEEMKALLTDGTGRSAMGRRAREKIVNKHNWLRNSKIVAQLLRQRSSK